MNEKLKFTCCRGIRISKTLNVLSRPEALAPLGPARRQEKAQGRDFQELCMFVRRLHILGTCRRLASVCRDSEAEVAPKKALQVAFFGGGGESSYVEFQTRS